MDLDSVKVVVNVLEKDVPRYPKEKQQKSSSMHFQEKSTRALSPGSARP